MHSIGRVLFALCAPLLLSACLLTPGKFTSTLDIRADRSFTFTYKGEVIAFDASKEMMKGLPGGDMPKKEKESGEEDSTDSDFAPTALADEAGSAEALDFSKDADSETKMKAMAEALSKEAGYKSVQYVGKNIFLIDYEAHGILNHGFVYPFNIDAEIVFPFIAIELRGKDMVRVKAPGFANEDSKKGGMGGMGAPAPESKLDGTFTLTTNAEIVSQNNEAGAVTAPNGRKIVWKATPLTKDEPMAVLRVVELK